jgi:hypothetical protein
MVESSVQSDGLGMLCERHVGHEKPITPIGMGSGLCDLSTL